MTYLFHFLCSIVEIGFDWPAHLIFKNDIWRLIELNMLFKCLTFISNHRLEIFLSGQVWDRLRLIYALNINFCLSGVIHYSAYFAANCNHGKVDSLYLLYHLKPFDIFLWRIRGERADLELVKGSLRHLFRGEWHPDHFMDIACSFLVLKDCLEDEVIEICVFCFDQADVVWRVNKAVPGNFDHELIWLITSDRGEPISDNILMLALHLNVVKLGDEECVIVTML